MQGAVEQARRQQPFRNVTDLCLRAGLDAKARECPADAGALKGLAGHRFQARSAMAAIGPQLPLFAEGAMVVEEIQELVAPTVGEYIETDPHQMRHVLEERADKVPKSLIARIDHSYHNHQENRPDAPEQSLPLLSRHPGDHPGPSKPEAFDQLAEWISIGARSRTSAVRRG